ncbi:MAG: sensor histidine kinase [Synechococcales bacterium]|nr:sensor histidine kinase [Synechococcales bacterium]
MTLFDPMITPRNHPLKFVLYSEWVLLAIAFLAEIPPFPREAPRSPGLNLLIIVIFAAMGLRLPTNPAKHRWIYLGLMGGLLGIGALGLGLRVFHFLAIALITRCCLLFPNKIYRWITGGTVLFVSFVQLYRTMAFQLPLIANRQMERLERLGRVGRVGRGRIDEFALDRAWLTSVVLLILFALLAIFIQASIEAILAERLSRQQLAIANEQLRSYALRVEDLATLQERNRIAREIHDSLGHSLTAFNLHLDAALRLFQSDPKEAQDLMREAKQLGSQALQDVRQSVTTLRSDPLQNQSLADSIQRLVEDFQRSTQVQPRVTIALSPEPSLPVKTALYRIVQESLTNIAKYAQASQVEISLQAPSPTQIQLRIQDNGIGFLPEQTRSGFGLQGMRERAIALGGQWQVRSQPGQGCVIEVQVPH